MQCYQYHVVCIPGPQNIADSLSRLVSGNVSDSSSSLDSVPSEAAELFVRFVAQTAVNAVTPTHVEEKSSTDEELKTLRKCINTGD